MQENDKAVLVYTTFPTPEAAEEVGAALVDGGVAACVNILPAMTSIYIWQGARQRDAEAVMIVKTRRTLAERVMADIRARHPYETPALLVLPVEAGSAEYLAWIVAQTTASPAGKPAGGDPSPDER
ncbi:MAG TPA: divalent-cation tolerance protein CutA [Hyphomicrobium sp.]|nr:divalent-cation tolerance protein CutA [Hyphomicrobium sp.]HRO49968.1 divalent-cation tolerance protein CutA [Hyphomicrobium sp.]